MVTEEWVSREKWRGLKGCWKFCAPPGYVGAQKQREYVMVHLYCAEVAAAGL